MLDKLRGARYLTTLDLKSGYWQVPLTSESKRWPRSGEGPIPIPPFRVMPFGLHLASMTFQRLLDKRNLSQTYSSISTTLLLSHYHKNTCKSFEKFLTTTGSAIETESRQMPVLRGPSQIPRPHRGPRRHKNRSQKGARNRRLARIPNR